MWNLEDFEYKTYHYERYRQLCLTDPVHTIVLKNYVESQVRFLLRGFYFLIHEAFFLNRDP